MNTPPNETPPAPKLKPRSSAILWLLLGLLALGIAAYLAASDSRRWLEAYDTWLGWQEKLAPGIVEQKPEPVTMIAKPGATPAPEQDPDPDPDPPPVLKPVTTPTFSPTPSTSRLEQQIRQLQATTRQQRQQIDTLLQQQNRLQTRIGADSPYARQAAMALGLLQLTIASANGAPFEAERRVLASLLPSDNDIGALRDFASEGVVSETVLLLRVPSLVDGLAASPTLQKDSDPWTWLKSWVTELVRIRRLDAPAGEGLDATLAHMESTARNGNLAHALAAAKELRLADASLADWMESARQRLELREHIESLSRTIASDTVTQ